MQRCQKQAAIVIPTQQLQLAARRALEWPHWPGWFFRYEISDLL